MGEQQQIVKYLDEKTAKIDALIDELNQQLDELALYRKAVISEAVTGKVDVRDWKPEDWYVETWRKIYGGIYWKIPHHNS